MIPMNSEDILIRAQSTPNPNAVKFITNCSLKTDGKATFNNANDAVEVVMALALFDIPGVTQVHFFQNSVTVTHTGTLSEEALRDQVISVLKTRLPIHNPDFKTPDERVQKVRHSGSPEIMQIEEILDRTIRSGLQADGGDIDVISFEDHVLRIMYQGACGTCPSSQMGTLDAIQSILQAEFDPEILVESV
jgi:Fe-S cluster biogenesis protein NfuA